jgi:hypothetical protein
MLSPIRGSLIEINAYAGQSKKQQYPLKKYIAEKRKKVQLATRR